MIYLLSNDTVTAKCDISKHSAFRASQQALPMIILMTSVSKSISQEILWQNVALSNADIALYS